MRARSTATPAVAAPSLWRLATPAAHLPHTLMLMALLPPLSIAATVSVITNDGRTIVVSPTQRLPPSAPALHPHGPTDACSQVAPAAGGLHSHQLLLCLLQGTLRGYDQATNLILDECHERVYSSKVRRLSWRGLHPAAGGPEVACVLGECLQCRAWRVATEDMQPLSGDATAALPRRTLMCRCAVDAVVLLQSGVEHLMLGLYVIRGDNM